MRESKNSKKSVEYSNKLLDYLCLDGLYKQRKFYIEFFKNKKQYFPIFQAYSIIDKNLRVVYEDNELGEYTRRGLYDFIRLTQLHFAIKYDDSLKTMYKNYDALRYYRVLKEIAHSLEFFPFLRRCEILSKKFGLYICDLMDHQIKIEITNDSSTSSNTIERIILPPYPIKGNMFKFIDCTNFLSQTTKKQNKIMKSLDYAIGITKGDRINKSNFGSLLKLSPFNFEFNVSLDSRLNGLWLWEQIHNPLNKERIKFTEAINILAEKIKIRAQSIEDFTRQWRNVLNNTNKCIQEGKFIPYGK